MRSHNSDLERTRGFVIHLERSEHRAENVSALLSQKACRLEVLDAVDAQQLVNKGRDFISDRPLFWPTYPFAIGTGEVGCFLSHRKAWQRIVDEDLPHALVIEDDAVILPGFAQALDLATSACGVDGYVQFQTRAGSLKGATIRNSQTHAILKPRVVPRRTTAQLVGRNAAARLLAVTSKVDRPVDGLLQLFWKTGQDILCVTPSGVSDASLGSTVQARQPKDILGQVKKSLRRSFYRAQIGVASALRGSG